MLSNLEILAVALLSVGGALFSAVLGWLDSGESFIGRKFAASMLHAIIGGFVIAVGNYAAADTITLWSLILAFLGGAGIDVLANRVEGSIAARAFAKTATATH